jgi:hypothetical protein
MRSRDSRLISLRRRSSRSTEILFSQREISCRRIQPMPRRLSEYEHRKVERQQATKPAGLPQNKHFPSLADEMFSTRVTFVILSPMKTITTAWRHGQADCDEGWHFLMLRKTSLVLYRIFYCAANTLRRAGCSCHLQ